MKKSTSKSYALRIDAPLVKPLQELKRQNRRSLNAEINAALEAWISVSNHADAATVTKEITPADASPSATVTSEPRAAAGKEAKRKTTPDTATVARPSGGKKSARTKTHPEAPAVHVESAVDASPAPAQTADSAGESSAL